jgi:hypothetical protein
MRRAWIGLVVVAAVAAALVAARVAGHAAGGPKGVDPAVLRPAPQPPAPAPVGIVDLPSPFPAARYLLDEKGWQELAGGERISVYAGALGADHRQGVVVVVTETLPKPHRTADFEHELDEDARFSAAAYPTPARDGAVRLIAAHAALLTLAAESGASFVFDVAARRYVNE